MRTRFALILYFHMVAYKAASHTLSFFFFSFFFFFFFEINEDMVQNLQMLEVFFTRILRLKICSVVLLPALIPACSSAIIS